MLHFLPIVLMLTACDPGQDSGLSQYLMPEGTLASRIVVQDVQSGVAGRVGVEIVIEPDGHWKKSRMWGEKRKRVLADGKLSDRELKNIAQVMHSESYNDLPQEFGQIDATVNPNPHYVRVAFGDKWKEVSLPSEVDMSDFAERTDPQNQKLINQFANIVGTIQKQVPGSQLK